MIGSNLFWYIRTHTHYSRVIMLYGFQVGSCLVSAARSLLIIIVTHHTQNQPEFAICPQTPLQIKRITLC